MKLIEYWGGVLSGYAPDLPKSTERHGEMLCLILIPQVGRKNLKNFLTSCCVIDILNV